MAASATQRGGPPRHSLRCPTVNASNAIADARHRLGIDIGGTGMKAAIVDVSTGTLVSERTRIATPTPATPTAMADVVVQLVSQHRWDGPVGVAFPAIVHNGVVRSAANIDASWLDVDADATFSAATGLAVHMVNDADAAGLAEMHWGAGRDRAGVVIMLTFGTGIGSGLFLDGVLVPNTELGHVELDGSDAEVRAAASARDRDDISWKLWAERVEHYLRHIELLFSPDLFILGGGVSKVAPKWVPRIDIATEVVVAELFNNAGIAGAALVAD